MVHGSLIGCCWVTVTTRDPAADTDFLSELHTGLEEVGIEPQESIDMLDQEELFVLIVAVIAHGGADDGVIFLFDEAVIVFAIGAAAREADLLLLTIAMELIVDELAAVVGIDTLEWKRETVADILQGLEDVALSLVLDHTCLRPGGGDIGEVQCLGIVTPGNAPIVGNQIDLHEAGLSFIPVSKSANGDVMFQQRAWFGARTAFETMFGFGGC